MAALGLNVSSDGLTWSSTLLSLRAEDLRSIAHGDPGFIAVGQDGTMMALLDPWWTAQPVASTLNRVAFGAGTYVTFGDNGTILAGNSLVWSPTSNSLYSVAYGNGQFVAVGAAGTILSCSNIVNWQLRTSPTTNDLYGVTYANQRFLIAGADGTILQSSPPPLELQFSSVQAEPAGVRAFITGDSGQPLRIEASTNLVDWTEVQVTNRPADGFITLDPNPPALPLRFYRAVVP
jgi:hypothetical protein